MIWKVTTFVSIVTTTLFASLYFSHKNNEELVIKKNIYLKEQSSEKKMANKAQMTKNKQDISNSKEKPNTKVVFRDINPFSHLSLNQIEKMEALYKRILDQSTKSIKSKNPYLFEKLALDEDQEKIFMQELGEKSMFKSYFSSDSYDEKILADIELGIEDILADKYEIYSQYDKNRKGYSFINRSEKQFPKDVEKLNQNQIEQLAELFNRHNEEITFYVSDNKLANLERVEEIHKLYNERIEINLAVAQEVLNHEQYKVFKKQVDSSRVFREVSSDSITITANKIVYLEDKVIYIFDE